MQGQDRFLSISGHARVTKEPNLIDQAWDKDQAVWFSEGRDDPHVVVLEVVPTYAEYWDRSNLSVFELILEKARGATGAEEARDLEAEAHGDVDLREKSL